MRDRLCQIIAYKPSVCNVDLDLLYRLAHTSDAVQILNKNDFKKHNGIDSGISPFCFFVQSLCLVIDEAPINRILYLSQHMILRYQIFYTQHLQLCLFSFILFSVHEKYLPLRYILYHIGRYFVNTTSLLSTV